jgi:hypothetical protein
MTTHRRYQLECWAFTALACAGVVWLVGERILFKAKGLRA